MTRKRHPLAKAIEPLLTAVGATTVPASDVESGDITLEWDGAPAIGVRLDNLISLDRLVRAVEDQMGSRLAELDREDKQQAVRLLNVRGAFLLRKAIEDVADIMGVSRITIYNYLNLIEKGQNK